MLKEIREQDDSRFPENTPPKPPSNDNQNKNMTHYERNSSYNKNQIHAVRQADMQLPESAQEELDLSQVCGFDADETYNEGYYVAVINMANEADRWGHCFNCGKEGHQWQECTNLLKKSLNRWRENKMFD